MRKKKGRVEYKRGILFKNKGKYYVLEVNSIPSWKAIQKISKQNVTEVLVSDFLKVLE